jgi:hypothetical protein
MLDFPEGAQDVLFSLSLSLSITALPHHYLTADIFIAWLASSQHIDID